MSLLARFPGLSRVETVPGTSSPFDLLGLNGTPLYLGHGPSSEPRVSYDTTSKPSIHPRVFDLPLNFGGGGDVANGAPDMSPANVQGASTPDLLIVGGQAASGSGGGLTVGALALLALLVVGGWFLYKKLKGA